MAEVYTTQQLETLTAAIAQGVLQVEYGDKKVTYRSLNEMLRLKKIMQDSLGIGKKSNGRKLASFNKGFK